MRFRSSMQREIARYLTSVATAGVAEVTEDELAVAVGGCRGSVRRSILLMQDRGVLSVRRRAPTVVLLPIATMIEAVGERQCT